MSRLLLSLLLVSSVSSASEVQCLSRIMFSEAKGESLLGALAIASASKNRSVRSGVSICKLKGVTSEPIPADLKPHFEALARSTLNSKKSVEKITKVIVITIVAAAESHKFRQKLTKPDFITLKNDNESNIS